MANLGPIYVKVVVSVEPTDFDSVGCQGMFIESVETCTEYDKLKRATDRLSAEDARDISGSIEGEWGTPEESLLAYADILEE